MMSNVVSVREFWDRKVQRIVQMYEYDYIDETQFRHELGVMGYDEETLDSLFEDD